ncbi:BLUF domain-containing protein [Sphingomonas yunnanensis]|uniref:BLUF domain-containing protein n=1 Tax=Sphingomonas yunnanensis TaxID=310400 RepID=UPI001CA6AD6F|nr:BLUF domain-containing protein [Sphingomonas yunnanensis]MBY9062553.1 BLUF domain-containing protein [Sphingomonas yunnanensis]
MADALHQIVYISRALAPLSDDAAAALCHAAAERNRAAGITGLLLHDGTRFIQAIEGEEAALRALMTRIARDPRHHSIGYVSDAAIVAREFGDWGMDYRRVEDVRAATDFLATVKRALAGVEDPGLLAAFIGFAVIGRGEHRRGFVPR